MYSLSENSPGALFVPEYQRCLCTCARFVPEYQCCSGLGAGLRRVAAGCAERGGLAWYQNLWERLCGLAWYQNLSERQLSPPSIFLNSEVSTVMTG